MSELSGPVVATFEGLAAEVAAGRLESPVVRDVLATLFPPPETADAEPAEPPAAHRIRVAVWHGTAVVAVEASRQPEMNLEDATPVLLDRVPGTDLWVRALAVETGRTYNFGVRLDGRPIGGGISPLSFPVYTPLSYPDPRARPGVLSERRTLVSEIYDGAEVEYWTYTNAGADPDRGAPLMVWLDGRGYLGAGDAAGIRLQTVTDNLVHAGVIPPMVHLLMSPAAGGSRDLGPERFHVGTFDFRVQQYDEISDEFPRHLLGEVIPHVEQFVRLRRDAYSRGIFGGSSGGTAAFKVGWLAPDAFSRLHPYLASFDGWGWRPADGIDGAHILPLEVRREARRNLRIWLSTGEHDDFDDPPPPHLAIAFDPADFPGLHVAGSQLLGNFEMAQALKTSGYDFHFRLGQSGHDFSQAGLDLPESLAWLWRDYDPDRTEQIYEQEPEERAKPAYRFGIVNRDTW